MAGIINDAMQPGTDAQQGDVPAPTPAPDSTQSQAAPQDQGATDGQANVTPEEQKQYESIITIALNQIYSERGFPIVIKKLGSFVDRPAFGIGHTAAMLLMSVKKGIEQKGGTVPDDVLFSAAQEVVSDLVDIAVGANVIDKETGDKIGEEAFYEGMKAYGQAMQDNGEITPELQDQAKQELADSGRPLPEQSPQSQSTQQPPQQSPQPPAGGIVNSAGV